MHTSTLQQQSSFSQYRVKLILSELVHLHSYVGFPNNISCFFLCAVVCNELSKRSLFKLTILWTLITNFRSVPSNQTNVWGITPFSRWCNRASPNTCFWRDLEPVHANCPSLLCSVTSSKSTKVQLTVWQGLFYLFVWQCLHSLGCVTNRRGPTSFCCCLFSKWKPRAGRSTWKSDGGFPLGPSSLTHTQSK